MNTNTAADWIQALQLKPHPEGGYYRETYRSTESIPKAGLPDRFSGPRSFYTAIYFLLEGNQFSAFHRIRADEMWHFYGGSPLILHRIDAGGNLAVHRLGAGGGGEALFQLVVPAGDWFAAEVSDRNGYALVGCTVAPGFDFADFELGRRAELLARFPRHAAIIERMTRL
jgi:predicted cupin superfamily sugar epimerase